MRRVNENVDHSEVSYEKMVFAGDIFRSMRRGILDDPWIR